MVKKDTVSVTSLDLTKTFNKYSQLWNVECQVLRG